MDGANYGNRLQNYALQQFLIKQGYDVETIRRKTYRDKSPFKYLASVLKDVMKVIFGKNSTNFEYRKRKKKFEKFNRKYIKLSKYCTCNNRSSKTMADEYDYFVCGSDQIWNTRFPTVECDIESHLAMFSRPNQRVSFAASIGTDDVEPKYKELFSEELRKFKAISVREYEGKKIAECLTGRTDIQVLLDPTLLLNQSEWEKIEKKPAYLENEKFLITYFLGNVSSKLSTRIKQFADSNKLKMVDLSSEFMLDNMICDKAIYQTTPNEFVWLLHHAEYIMTDSFHAVAFSIIFEKQFYVYEREDRNNNMGSRIKTLLSKFDLINCKDDSKNSPMNSMKIDYSNKNLVLKKEQNNAISFLNKALSAE